MLDSGSVQLRSVRVSAPAPGERDAFPFTVPALRELTRLDFPSAVTVFVGENGSGKSTLLEAVALMARLPTVGSAEAVADDSLAQQRRLSKLLSPQWANRSHRGFFLRAEDFFGFTRRLNSLKKEMQDRITTVDREYGDRSDWAKGLAKGPAAASIAAMESRYGKDLDANSHGESFLKLFQARFVPGGLYLLDEPEAALSPQSQLALIAMMRDMVDQGGQFVLATHSPILMAIPGSTIYDFDQHPVAPVAYGDLESVELLKNFLQSPQRFLRHLWPEGKPE